MTKYPCPCCGYLTLAQEPPGTFLLCRVCRWEDDPIQVKDPDYTGGANRPSLNQARENFLKFGAKEERFIDKVRAPLPSEIP
ncbi:MAG: hypothetical protein JSV77_01420 [Dehalococcoidales bacterium]|nr:MAG: hypothetical protein JSV77_01420 [Dehalococcoidales bacterium]